MRITTSARAAATAALLTALSCGASAQAGPSFDCTQKLTTSVEQRICQDPGLAALDRQLAETYAAAMAKATPAESHSLTTSQRGWIKSRNDCWKAKDAPACVDAAYHNRIAELQARYRLVNPVGSARYLCPGAPAMEIAADFFATDPPTAMIAFSGATQFMTEARSGSGARYTGGGRQFWEHQGVALLTWGPGAPESNCPRQ